MTENEARQMEVEIKWNGRANVCVHCGKVPETYYITTGHDHTDDSIRYCFCRSVGTYRTKDDRMSLELLPAQSPVDVTVSRCTVRVKTTIWADNRGLHTRKSLTFLRRQCEGFNVLDEDASAIGAEKVLPRILNLGEVEDGIYEVIVCNKTYDYETGYIEDYDYQLVIPSASVTGAEYVAEKVKEAKL